MRIGGDFPGAAYYQKAAVQASEPGDCFGIMPETFGVKGTGWDTVEAFGRCGKFFEGVVHITPFDGTHRYPIKQLLPLIRKNVIRMERIANKYPNTIWMISIFCEHNHPRSRMEPLYRRMKELAPSCLFVNSIWQGEEVAGMLTEIHLESPNKLPRVPRLEYLVSYDGFGGDGKCNYTDADHTEILNKYASARHIRYWGARCNGKFKPNQPKPPTPNNRTYWPDVHYLKGHRVMLTGRQGGLTWQGNALLKPFAEDHGEGGKDNKLMFILPRGGDSIEVIDMAGNVIDRPTTMGLLPHPDGPRYYSKLYAYQVGEIAVRNTASRLVLVRCGKDVYPLTDVVLRSGKFR